MEVEIYKLVLNKKRIAVDGESQDGKDGGTGLFRVTGTNIPAIQQKGLAFSDDGSFTIYDNTKKIEFTDEVKMRIFSPVLIPNLAMPKTIDNKKVFVLFTEEDAEEIYKRFMQDMTSTEIFNINHTDEKDDCYLFETLFLDTPAKIEYIKNEYNQELPLNSIIQVKQYNNIDSFTRAIEEGRTGASLEGFFDMVQVELIEEPKEIKNDSLNQTINKNTKNNMIKKVINDAFLEFESMEVGAKVIDVLNKENSLSFSFKEDEKEYIVEDGEIKDIKEVEKEPDTPANVDKVEMRDESKVADNIEDNIEDTANKAGLTEDDVIKIIKPELDKLYDALAAINIKNDKPADESETLKIENKSQGLAFKVVNSTLKIKTGNI